jgi:hypothetical protein
MKAAIFWHIAPCSPDIIHRFKGTYHFHLQGRKTAEKKINVLEASSIYLLRLGGQSKFHTDIKSMACKIGKVVKLSLQDAVGSHMIVRHRDSHIFQTVGSQMAMRLSALCAGRPHFTAKMIPGTHFC